MTARPLSALLHHYAPDWLGSNWPMDWHAVFGRSAPLSLEIGFGNGDFLIRLAEQFPEEDFVGIELAWGSVQRLLRRIDAAGLSNVRVIQGDGAYLLPRLFATDSLHAVYANHSDPWPKERHHPRRLIQTSFLSLVHDALVPGGTLLVATDHAEYAEWIADRFEEQDALQPANRTPRVHHIPGRVPTRYEAKARSAGIRIHFFPWIKPQDAPPAPSRTWERKDDMPHVVLEGTLSDGPLIPGSEPELDRSVHQDTHVVVKLLHRYRGENGSWMVETLVQEGPLHQHFAILIAPHEDGWLVKLAAMGTPRPTWGVKRALAFVAERIQSAHPGVHAARSTVG